MVDGNCREAREHRMAELRAAQGWAVPGQALGVYAPAPGLVPEVLPCAHDQAQERSRCGALLKTGEAGALWSEARHFGTRDLRCAIDTRGAFCITRAHRGRRVESGAVLRAGGRTETGRVAHQRVTGVAEQGHAHGVRRVRSTLKHATREGATMVPRLPH
jgi:hypothetical protein